MPERAPGGRLAGPAILAALVSTCSGNARAANGSVPRTPPVFVEPACLSVVDRAVDPVFHLDYAIPFEDTELTPDEPFDARTFQFFAVCRDFSAAEGLPSWITDDDVMRSIATGAIRMAPPAAQVLQGNPAWSTGHDGASGTCVLAMNAIPDRIPITCAATNGGLDWDTSGVPAGNYRVWGYTFQPSINLWTPRPGVVRITDGDEAALPPVVSLSSPWGEPTVYAQDGYRILGCMAGTPGTTVRVQWAAINQELDDPASWSQIGAELDAAEGSFDLLFLPPAEAENQAVLVRAIATDPQGRTWTAYTRGAMIVLPGDGCSEGPETPPGPDFCEAYPEAPQDGTGEGPACADGGASDSGASDGTAGEGDATSAPAGSSGSGDSAVDHGSDGGTSAPADGPGACACRGRARAPSGSAWWSLGLLLLGRRGRRRAGPPRRSVAAGASPPRAGTTGESRATLQAV